MRLANAVKHRLYVRDSRAYGRNGRFRAEGWPEREGMLSCSYRLSASEENPRCWRLNRTLEALLYKI